MPCAKWYVSYPLGDTYRAWRALSLCYLLYFTKTTQKHRCGSRTCFQMYLALCRWQVYSFGSACIWSLYDFSLTAATLGMKSLKLAAGLWLTSTVQCLLISDGFLILLNSENGQIYIRFSRSHNGCNYGVWKRKVNKWIRAVRWKVSDQFWIWWKTVDQTTPSLFCFVHHVALFHTSLVCTSFNQLSLVGSQGDRGSQLITQICLLSCGVFLLWCIL